jgi:hypothetical protein
VPVTGTPIVVPALVSSAVRTTPGTNGMTGARRGWDGDGTRTPVSTSVPKAALAGWTGVEAGRCGGAPSASAAVTPSNANAEAALARRT